MGWALHRDGSVLYGDGSGDRVRIYMVLEEGFNAVYILMNFR